ncbi:hypothetical protein F5887DRAFT_1158536 [Amanita rubescens]|nr:hypothetical protein F5887DRAFT_1158536 [Amanita rubescens]
MFPPSVPVPDSNPDPNPNPNLNLDLEDSDPTPPIATTDSDHLLLADLLTYRATDVHTAGKVYNTILPSFLSRCPHPVSFSGVLTMGSSFLTVDSAWERGVGDEREGDNDDEGVGEGSVVGTVGLDLEKGGKIEGCLPEDPVWLSTLASPSRIIPLLLKLAYNGFPLKLSSKEGNVGKLRTVRGQKTSQILGPRHAKLLLASGEMTSDDNDLAMALSSGSKDQDDRIQELAARVMDEKGSRIRHRSRSVVLSTRLESKEKVKTERAGEAESARRLSAEIVLGLDETQKRFTSRYNRSHPNCATPVRVGVERFHSREHGWIYRVPSSVSETSKHGSSLTFSNPADLTLADLVLHHGFAFHKLPHKDGEKANVGSPLGKTFVKYAADGVLTSPGGEAEDGRADKDDKWGIILPQVITMGTVTRRAIEKICESLNMRVCRKRREEVWASNTRGGYEELDCMVHRAKTAAFLKAQTAQDFKGLVQKVHGVGVNTSFSGTCWTNASANDGHCYDYGSLERGGKIETHLYFYKLSLLSITDRRLRDSDSCCSELKKEHMSLLEHASRILNTDLVDEHHTKD